MSTAHSWRCYPFVQRCYPIFGVVTSPSAHTHTLTLSQRHRHKQKHTQAHTHTHAKHMGEYCTFLALLPFCSALIPHIWRGYLTICTHTHTHTGTKAQTQTQKHTQAHTHTHAKHMGEYCTFLALLPFCSALIPHIWRGYLTICTHTHSHWHKGTDTNTKTHTGTHTHTHAKHMGEYCTFLALLPFCSALIPHIWRGYLTICTHTHTHTGTKAQTQTQKHTQAHTHTRKAHG